MVSVTETDKYLKNKSRDHHQIWRRDKTFYCKCENIVNECSGHSREEEEKTTNSHKNVQQSNSKSLTEFAQLLFAVDCNMAITQQCSADIGRR